MFNNTGDENIEENRGNSHLVLQSEDREFCSTPRQPFKDSYDKLKTKSKFRKYDLFTSQMQNIQNIGTNAVFSSLRFFSEVKCTFAFLIVEGNSPTFS